MEIKNQAIYSVFAGIDFIMIEKRYFKERDMKKLFKKIVTFMLIFCLAITSCTFSFFACSSSPVDGKDGVDGVDGADGKDGVDGVSVVDAFINADGDLIIVLSDGSRINCGKVSGTVGGGDADDGDSGDSGVGDGDSSDDSSNPDSGDEGLMTDDNGNPLTGVASDGKYYENGVVLSFGYRLDSGILYEIYDGVMTPLDGVYEEDDKLYSNGELFNGFDDEYNLLYVGGELFTGIFASDNLYYSEGELFTGKDIIDGYLYDIISGEMTLYSGVYRGKEYENGQLISTIKFVEGKLYEYTEGVKSLYSGLYENKLYRDGELVSGVYENKYYENGVLLGTGIKIIDNKAYQVLNGDMTVYSGYYQNLYYYNGVLHTGNVVYQGKAYDVVNGVMSLYTGEVEGKYYVNGDLANGQHNDKVYENGTLLNGMYLGKFYTDGELFTGIDNSKLYVNGELHTGEYEGKHYTNGVEVELVYDGDNLANGLYNGIVYANGLPFTGVYSEDGKYYKDGIVLESGTLFVERILYTITDGIMVKYDGEYENKLYENGELFSGIRVEDSILYQYNVGVKSLYSGIYENKLYTDGLLFNGLNISDGKVYSNGELHTGEFEDKYYSNGELCNGLYTDGKVYSNGLLFSGLYTDGKIYSNGELLTGEYTDGKIYQAGLLLTGEYTDGLYYKNGEKFTGRVNGTLYENGERFTGEYTDGKVYVNGKILTGVYNDKYYNNGTLLSSGRREVDGKLYSIAEGVMTLFSGINQNKYYENGELYTGITTVNAKLYSIESGVMTLYDGEYDGKQYLNGVLKNGIYDDKLYSEGVLFSGVFTNGKLYENGVLVNGVRDDKLYENGVLFTGLNTSDGKVYVDGVLLTGTYTDGKMYVNGGLFTGEIGDKLYKDGVLFDGVHDDGKKYKDGVLLTGADSEGKMYVDGLILTGTYTDGKYYENGELFSGLKDGKLYKNGLLFTGTDSEGNEYNAGVLVPKDDSGDSSQGVTIESIQAKYDALGVTYTDVASPITITMAHHDNEGANQERRILDILLQAFNKRYPNITVQLDIIGEYEDTYTSRIASGSVHDVFAVPDGKYHQWQAANRLYNLTSSMNNSPLVDTSDMYSSVVTRFQTSGAQYVMPRDISVNVMYYNKDMFDARGVAYPPSDRIMTIDEATEMWKSLTYTGASGKIFGTAGLGMEGLVWSAGGDFLNSARTGFPTDTTTVNGIKRAYQYIQDAYFVHQCMPHSSDLGTMDASAYFVSQKVATIIDGSWNMATFRSNTFNWDIAYVPAFEVAPTKNGWSGSVGYAINKNGSKLAASWKLVEYIGSKEGQEILAATGFQFPLYKSLGDDASYIASQATLKPANYKIYIESAKTQPGGTWTYSSSTDWKTLGYDLYSQNLLDSDESQRWTIDQFISSVKSAVDLRLS